LATWASSRSWSNATFDEVHRFPGGGQHHTLLWVVPLLKQPELVELALVGIAWVGVRAGEFAPVFCLIEQRGQHLTRNPPRLTAIEIWLLTGDKVIECVSQ
jgi:hypothetical protein